MDIKETGGGCVKFKRHEILRGILVGILWFSCIMCFMCMFPKTFFCTEISCTEPGDPIVVDSTVPIPFKCYFCDEIGIEIQKRSYLRWLCPCIGITCFGLSIPLIVKRYDTSQRELT